MEKPFSSVGDSKIVTCSECGKQARVTIKYKHQTSMRSENPLELPCGHFTKKRYDERLDYHTRLLEEEING